MSKQSLLLVDGDTRSLRVLEVSLRKAGFMVTAALSVQDALDKLELHAPDLIISETTFPDGDGFDLRRRVRATPDWAEIPFIFLTAEAAIENKIRGLELGVDDYLTKPIYIKEIVTRINILLQKRQRVRFEERRDGRTRFAGRVQDMPVVDVIQTIEISRKSGVIQFVGERGRQAAIYFRDGRVIDAEAGSLQGEDAVYRLLTWNEGEFEVVFRTVRRREVITKSSQALLMEGMRRLDEWSRLFEQLPPLTHRFEVDTIELAARLGDVPDDNNRILRLVDGKRTLLEVIDGSDVGDLECLQAISRLYFEELLIDLDQGADHGKTPRRDTGKAVPLLELEGANAGEEASGPVGKEPSSPDRSERAFSEAGLAERGTGAPALGANGDAAGANGDAADASGGVAGADGTDELEVEPVGPLRGGYRPSSLRLIDEAVAAAQAIEPSLFDDDATAAPVSPWNGQGADSTPGSVSGEGATAAGRAPDAASAGARDGAASAGARDGAASVDPPQTPADVAASASGEWSREASAKQAAVDREESGLKMIGSLGRDRAEASGELAPLGHARPVRSETARELVTILPRRATREMPIVSTALAEASSTPTTLAARAAAIESDEAGPRGAAPGSGVPASGRSRRIVQLVHSIQDSGPGFGAMLLIVLAIMLAGTAVFLRLRRPTTGAPTQSSPYDARGASTRSGTRPSAALGVAAGDGAEGRRDTGNAASAGARVGAPPPGSEAAAASGAADPASGTGGTDGVDGPQGPGNVGPRDVVGAPQVVGGAGGVGVLQAAGGAGPVVGPQAAGGAGVVGVPQAAGGAGVVGVPQAAGGAGPVVGPQVAGGAGVVGVPQAAGGAGSVGAPQVVGGRGSVGAPQAAGGAGGIGDPGSAAARGSVSGAGTVGAPAGMKPRAVELGMGPAATAAPAGTGRTGGVSEGGVVGLAGGVGSRAVELGMGPGAAVPGSGAQGAPLGGGGQDSGRSASSGSGAASPRSARVNSAGSPSSGAERISSATEPAATVGQDGASRSAGRDVRADRTIEAKSLCDRASDALDEGDFARALELATASLKLRRTTRGYLLRARAEQRLGRVDAALRSLDAATEFAPNLAAIWEQRGRILWAARRRDEARVAFTRFLDLAPNSPNAGEIQRMISEQP